MKNNWNGLTEKAKEIFADYYIFVKANKEKIIECVFNEGRCETLCWTLFPDIEEVQCPCSVYGSDAFKALESCLIEDGWIKEDD